MESFEIQWRNSTRKDLRSLPRQEVARIVLAVADLAGNPQPNGSQKLSGSERTYRIRVGDYRVIYEVLLTRASLKFSESDIAKMFIANSGSAQPSSPVDECDSGFQLRVPHEQRC